VCNGAKANADSFFGLCDLDQKRAATPGGGEFAWTLRARRSA
jgi:hypothetical protein